VGCEETKQRQTINSERYFFFFFFFFLFAVVDVRGVRERERNSAVFVGGPSLFGANKKQITKP